MLTTDPDGLIVSFNRSASRLLAYTAGGGRRQAHQHAAAGREHAGAGREQELRARVQVQGRLAGHAEHLDVETVPGRRPQRLHHHAEGPVGDQRPARGAGHRERPSRRKSAYHFEPGLIYLCRQAQAAGLHGDLRRPGEAQHPGPMRHEAEPEEDPGAVRPGEDAHHLAQQRRRRPARA